MTMKLTLNLLAALLLAHLTTYAQQTPSPANATVRDHLWIFTLYAGASNREIEEIHYIDDYAPGGSRMTPAEGAFWLGVPNLLLIRHKNIPPLPGTEAARAKTTFEQYAISFQPLDRVVWSVIGGGGEGGMNELQPVLDLAKRYQNFRGIFLDDFIRPGTRVNGKMVGRPSLQREDLSHVREQMKVVGRPMEVWVTLYTHDINASRKTAAPTYRGCEPPLASFLDQFDVLTLWTWNSDEIPELEANLTALERIAPKKARIALGLYLWDFHNKKPVPVDLMKHQCDLGLKWLKEGRISDMIFLANTILDVGMPSAEFSREWIKKHGQEKLN
jgi:hypothetical protein